MSKLILYIAASIDGFIAKEDGSVGWLDEIPNPDQSDYGYGEFYGSVSSLIMGRKTYEQVKGFGEWPYTGKKSFVFSRNQQEPYNHVEFIAKDHIQFTKDLKNKSEGDIWLVGGGRLNTFMLEAGLLDEILLFQMPVVLGKGLPLFPEAKQSKPFKLLSSSSYSSGVSLLHYQV